jgi:CRISPR/Cas system-associated exonuclease Cas4 (RecB family)
MMKFISRLTGHQALSPSTSNSNRASPDASYSVIGADRDYISFSAIRTYQTCPLRYYFKYVAGLPEESVAATLVFGSAIHRAIEHHFRALMAGQKAPSMAALMAAYEAGWQDREAVPMRFGKEETREGLRATARRMLEVFAASSFARPSGHVLAVEQPLRGPVVPGVPDLLGRVDLMIEKPAELVVVDWKTARARWNAEQVDEAAEQLLLYAELARDWAPGKRLRLEFAVITKAKEPTVERHSCLSNPCRIDRTKRVMERVWRAIQAEHFFPAPSPINCAGCPFRRPCKSWIG